MVKSTETRYLSSKASGPVSRKRTKPIATKKGKRKCLAFAHDERKSLNRISFESSMIAGVICTRHLPKVLLFSFVVTIVQL